MLNVLSLKIFKHDKYQGLIYPQRIFFHSNNYISNAFWEILKVLLFTPSPHKNRFLSAPVF